MQAAPIHISCDGPGLDCLPEDIIIIICQKASTTNIQYVHLRAVCKIWRRALIPNPCHLSRQAPRLFICPTDSDRSQLSFYDLSQSRVHEFVSPDMSGKEMLGNYYGWIVLVQEEKVSLYNPITRGSISEMLGNYHEAALAELRSS